MENFLLWGASQDRPARALSFFATAVNLQRINEGTRDMIARMLQELGAPDAEFTDWNMADRFLTNYLTDDPESDEWEDSWSETWEITLHTTGPVDIAPRKDQLARTRAYDDTWHGEQMPFPTGCVVVADFNGEDSAASAEKALNLVGELRDDAALVARLSAEFPEAKPALFDQIMEAYTDQEGHSFRLSVQRRPGVKRQLIIRLGEFDEEFYVQGATLAHLVSDLCAALGGTTTRD